jgi:hypothetical protein
LHKFASLILQDEISFESDINKRFICMALLGLRTDCGNADGCNQYQSQKNELSAFACHGIYGGLSFAVEGAVGLHALAASIFVLLRVLDGFIDGVLQKV